MASSMSTAERSSPCLPPDQIRNLVVELEQMGIESSRIDVVADPATSVEATSKVDRETMARPAGRAAKGAVIGLVVGLVIGALLVTLADGLPNAILLATAIAGVALGALFGLYSRLPVTTDVVDVETGQDSYVRVDVSGMDDDTIADVERLVTSS